MKKALKRIYMILGAWVLVLLCPVVCCESEVLMGDQDVVLSVGTIYYTGNYLDGHMEAIGQKTLKWQPYIDYSKGMGGLRLPVTYTIKNGNELFSSAGMIAKIRMYRDGSIRIYKSKVDRISYTWEPK